MWQVKFLNEAKKDLAKLDNSLKGQVLKGIAKVRTNPPVSYTHLYKRYGIYSKTSDT